MEGARERWSSPHRTMPTVGDKLLMFILEAVVPEFIPFCPVVFREMFTWEIIFALSMILIVSASCPLFERPSTSCQYIQNEY